MRPPGPLPTMPVGSSSCSRSRRRTSGDTRAPRSRSASDAARAAAIAASGPRAGTTGSVGSAGACADAVAFGACADGPDAPLTSSSQMTSPTATSAPTSTSSRTTVPAAGLGISVSTLSVDTSASACPWVTVSPIATSQATIVPPSTDSPSSGSATRSGAGSGTAINLGLVDRYDRSRRARPVLGDAG